MRFQLSRAVESELMPALHLDLLASCVVRSVTPRDHRPIGRVVRTASPHVVGFPLGILSLGTLGFAAAAPSVGGVAWLPLLVTGLFGTSIAWRLWSVGVEVKERTVVVRNVLRTWRVPVDQAAGFTFAGPWVVLDRLATRRIRVQGISETVIIVRDPPTRRGAMVEELNRRLALARAGSVPRDTET